MPQRVLSSKGVHFEKELDVSICQSQLSLRNPQRRSFSAAMIKENGCKLVAVESLRQIDKFDKFERLERLVCK